MSDWFGVHDTIGPIKAGLDLEMPFPVFRAGKLVEAVRSGATTEENIDYRVSKMLELRNRLRRCLEQVPETSEIDEETNQTARELASGGIVLLKNDNDTLPLRYSHDTKIAVIGGFAQNAVVTGGGSASCNPQYRQSPLQFLQEMHTDPGNLRYAAGVRTRRIIPLATSEILTSQDGRKGIDIKYFNDDSPEPICTEFRGKSEMWMLGNFKPGLKVPGSHVELTTQLTPLSTGRHVLAVRCTGSFSLSINGEQVMTGPQPDVTTEQFLFNHILIESRTWLSMEAGKPYDIKLVMKSRDKMTIGEPTPYAASICFEEYYSEEAAIAEAVEIARTSDTSIIFAGRDGQYESEGFDLEDIRMPANQTALIKAVAAVSKKTVLVMHCGNPIDVSAFVDDVDAVLNAHFPGQEGPRAIVDILTGSVNPSGRLTTTWFKTIQDAPSFGNFPATRQQDGSIVMRYAEGLKMGYRHPEQERARWPFGFGLSYTSFSYGDLIATVEDDGLAPKIVCSVQVTNTGPVAGHEVIQLFVTPAETTVAWRPAMELKAFAKVYLQPGESATVPLDMDLQLACSYWDEVEKSWRMDTGAYGLVVGPCRVDISVAKGSLWNHL
jgi:beta-glucosidase